MTPESHPELFSPEQRIQFATRPKPAPEIVAEPVKAKAKAKPKADESVVKRRFSLVNELCDIQFKRMSLAEIAVITTLWRHADKDDVVIRGQLAISADIGTDPKTVRKALTGLLDKQIITILEKGKVDRVSTKYRINRGKI